MQQMELFGQFFGYSINDSKSSILFLIRDERLNPIIQTLFIDAKEGFVYLGVKSAQTPQDESLNKWMTMPISMFGRINMIKMKILPNFFISLPVTSSAPPKRIL